MFSGPRGAWEKTSWVQPWERQWRLVLFDAHTGQNVRRERLRCYLRDKGLGYLQNSVWISPDPLAPEREILGGGKINVESLILLEARSCACSLAHRMGEGGRQAA